MRERENRFRADRKFSLGNSARRDRFSLGERSICRAAGRASAESERARGEGVAKVFIVSRRHDARVFLRIGRPTARVLAGRCANVCCLGGCVRFVFVLLSPSLSLSLACSSPYPVLFPLHAVHFARFDVFRSVFPHPRIRRARVRSRGMIRRGHGQIIFAARHLDVNIRGISSKEGGKRKGAR